MRVIADNLFLSLVISKQLNMAARKKGKSEYMILELINRPEQHTNVNKRVNYTRPRQSGLDDDVDDHHLANHDTISSRSASDFYGH